MVCLSNLEAAQNPGEQECTQIVSPHWSSLLAHCQGKGGLNFQKDGLGRRRKEQTEYSFDTLEHRIRELAFLNSGVHLRLIDNRGS